MNLEIAHTIPQEQPSSHKNVMELLVEAEINQQLKKAPPKLAQYLNCTEIATYALNRLPTLYASSEEGIRKQQQRGQREYKDQIRLVVRQAFAAVQRDPIRMSTPLLAEQDLNSPEAQEVLQMLADFLEPDELAWEKLAELATEHSSKKARLRSRFY
jgi:hypothetical protein